MKNQYFGDVNDYRKYGILRSLAAQGLKITFCWMLTENDSRTDGRHITYLHQTDKFKHFDQPLFESLHSAVIKKKKRSIDWVESKKLVPSARFHATRLADDAEKRYGFFQELTGIARNSDIIFFDPDNGLEVMSKLRGKKGSCKYLYWDEVEKFWKLGHSLLIYQHFPRVNRMQYIRMLSKKLKATTNAKEVITFKTSTVAFFLLPQAKHRKKIHAAVEGIQMRWKGMIEVVQA